MYVCVYVCMYVCMQEVAEYLLQHKADVNGTNLSGATPLFLAVESIHKEMCQVKTLLYVPFIIYPCLAVIGMEG